VVLVSVTTLGGPKHSGQYGGAAPDSLIVLLHALATLHDEKGNVAVAGLRREPWKGASYTEEEFRELAEIKKGLPLFGTGGLGEHLWSGPAITITGLDALPVKKAVNAVVPTARASINLRVHPEQNADEAQDALVKHLQKVKPFGVELKIEKGATGNGFAAKTEGPAYDSGRAALSSAWGGDTVKVASGGSIPLVNALHQAVPNAEILLLGATDGFSNIHAPNERVLLDEFKKTVIAEAEFFQEYASRFADAKSGGKPAA
jgi:acetylornithine deacetylase/succinyl-diaminopimelate desuccinylase-like protein